MEGESYEHSLKTEDLKKRGRKGRQAAKEEVILENPEDVSIEASEDDEPSSHDTRRRSSSIQNKQSNPKGERKQSNAKGERKPSNPKGERKQSYAKGQVIEVIDVEEIVVVENKRQTRQARKAKTMEVENHSHEAHDEICEVCYSNVSEPFLNEEMKSLFEKIRCQGCDMSVHKICYGYKTYQNASTFLCDECREDVEDAKCYICGVQEGCLRFMKKDQWVHSVCGIANGTIQYKDAATMEIDLHDFRKETQKLPAIRRCKECENKVETLQTDNNTQEYCHLHCALKTNVPSDDQKSHWEVKFSLKNEENLHVYKQFDEKKLTTYIESLQLKLKGILQKSTLAKETGLFEMKEKKGTRAKRGEKSSEEIEESLAIALETVKEVAKQSYEGMNPVQENDEDLKIIGGKISLTHEEKTLKNKKQKKTKRTMEEEPQGNNLANILISLNKEILNPLSILEVYSQNNFSKLRSDLPEFPTLESLSFPELLFFVIVFQIRAQAVSDNLTTAQDLCKLANSAKFLPFTLSNFLRMINEKFYLSVATDILTKPWIALCYPKSAYNPTEKKFSQEVMERNSDAMVTCQQILDLFTKKPCGVITNEFELGMQYYQNLSFLQEFYNNLSGLFAETSRNRSSSPDKNKTPKKGSDDLPEVHVSLIMELSAKRSALGFIDDQLEELKLLDKLNNRSAVTLSVVDGFFRSAEKSSSSSKKSRLSDSCSKSANSSVNKSMYTELAGKLSMGKASVHSPVKDESKNTIRANPEGLAALNRQVEESNKEKVTAINEKESLVNAEKKLKQMKAKFGSAKNKEVDPEIKSLEAEINKVKVWKMELIEAEKKKQNLEEHLDKIGELDFRVNEMFKALNWERKWLLWRNTAQNLSSQLRQKRSSQDQENTKSNVKNLELIVKDGEELKHIRPDDGLWAGLNEKLAMIRQIQAAIKDHDCTLEKLQGFENNLKHINIHFPEANKLHLKIKLMKEVERISRDFVSLNELEEFFKTFNDHIDLIGNYQMQMEIKNHIEQGREIQNKANDKSLISIDSDLFEAQEMAQLVKQTRESRMIIDQVKQVEDEVNRVLALWKIYACLTLDKLPTVEQLESGEFDHLEGKSLKQILQDCEGLLAGKILNLPKERVNILKQTLTTFELKSEFHQKLAKFFECLDGAILTGCINEIKDTMEVESGAIEEAIQQEEISKDEKIHFIEKSASIAVLNLSNQIFFDMLDQLGLQVGATFNEMLELAEAKATKINKIHAKVEQLANNVEDFPEQIKAQIVTIKQLKERSDWISRVAANKQARGLTGWKYSDLKHFVEKFEELGIPSNFAICRELTEMRKIGETMKQTYETSYGKERREALEGKKPAKKYIEDVPQIICLLYGQVCLEDEINEVGEDVNRTGDWTKSIENTTQNFLNGLEDNNFEGTEESLREKLHRFLDTKLALKDKEGDKSIKLLTWLADAEEVMTGKPDLFELGTFEKIRQDAEGWIKKDIKLEKLIDKINEQITCANLIIETANELKEVENDAKNPGYTYEILEEFLNNIRSCKVELKEERQYLDNIAQKSKLLKEGVEMMKKEGANRMTINDLQMKLMEMGSVPIMWQEELVFVQEAKDKATKTIEICREFEKNKTFENLKKVAEHYQKCLLQHEKAEECEKTYNQVVQNQDILKSKIEEINAFSMSFEELQDFREKAQLVAEYIKEDWIQELKATIFFKLCKALQNSTDLTQISSQQLNSMIQECNSMTQDDNTKEALAIVQAALPKVEALEKEREEEEIKRKREEELQIMQTLPYDEEEDDYPEPAIEPEFSESSNPLAQFKITNLEDYLIKEQEEKELRKPIEPFTPTTEEEHQYVRAFKKILSFSEDIKVSDLQITTYARCIIATFPEVLDSLDAFARVTGRLKTLLKYPFITKRLVRRDFDSAYLSRLIRKEEAELKSYEKKLRDHDGIMNSEEKGLAPHESLTKKLKTDGNAETTPPKDLEVEKQDNGRSPNPFTACHIDKLTKTNSDRRNPLKKLLKGEDVSDFLKEDNEDLRGYDPYIGGGDQEVFSENEEEKEYQGVQPESEIKYDKNLLAQPLKASVGKGQRKENILYDPDNPNEIIPNNENHKDPRKRLRNSTSSDKLPDFKKMPPGSILRIFDGILRQGDGNKGFKVEFFTCDPYNVVNTLPQIVKEGHASLRITGKFSLSKFQAYFNKCLNNFTAKKTKEEVVVSGWIESHVEMYQKELEEIASDLDSSNKVIMINYNESSKIYVLTNKQFNPQWRRLLDFRFKKVQKESRPYLYYIIIHKPYKLAHDTISLVPDPVPEFGGNLPIFDLNSVHNFEIIKKRHRKTDSDDASLLLEQNTDMGGDDLWDQQPVISQPTIPRGNKPYSPTMKSLNTKRNWEEIHSDRNSKFNDDLGPAQNGDRTKKVKSEFGFVTKYLGVEDQAENNHYQPKTTFQEETFFQEEEEPVGELDVMVKKMAKMDRADLIRILEDMEEQDIVELATKMDQRMRDNVISILKDLNKTQAKKQPEDNHKIPKRSHKVYQPPQHIKAFFNLFTPEQMSLAKRRVEAGYQVPVKEESLIQTIPEDEEDFGAIIPESSAMYPKIVPKQMQNKVAPKSFNNNLFTQKPSVPIQITDNTIQMSKQVYALLSQIQNTPMQRVIAVNQPKPAIKTQSNQAGNKIFFNKFPANKENQNLGKFNQGLKFTYQKQGNHFNNNKRVSFNN